MSSFIDEEQAIQIYYDLDSQRRKDLVNTLGEILQREPKYLGTPTFNYEVAASKLPVALRAEHARYMVAAAKYLLGRDI